MRTAHDSAERLHIGEALALPGRARIHLLFRMEFRSDIATYTNGDAHKEIVRHARALKGAKAVVKLYELVQ